MDIFDDYFHYYYFFFSFGILWGQMKITFWDSLFIFNPPMPSGERLMVWPHKMLIFMLIEILASRLWYLKMIGEREVWGQPTLHCPWMLPLLYDRQRLKKVKTGSEITVLEYLPYYMTGAHEGQHWKWNHCPWMHPLLYVSGSWRSTLEVKLLSLNASPTIWQGLMKVNTGSEITLLECLP